jgi:hypothetical protein
LHLLVDVMLMPHYSAARGASSDEGKYSRDPVSYGSGATVPYWTLTVAVASRSHRTASVPDDGSAGEESRLLPGPNVAARH